MSIQELILQSHFSFIQQNSFYVPGTVVGLTGQSLPGDGRGGDRGTAKRHKEIFRDNAYSHKLDG